MNKKINSEKLIVIIIFITYFFLIGYYFIVNFSPPFPPDPITADYPNEKEIIGTYQKVDTIEKKDRDFITINKTSSVGIYSVHRYYDFEKQGYLPIFYIASCEIKYNPKEYNFYFPGHINWKVRYTINNNFLDILPDSPPLKFKKISNEVLTEKELNINHFPVQSAS